MPLPLPVIDRRTWDDLISEARALLPGFDPQWTDQNISDPGVTMVELFGWITEILTYRADRVPPAQMRAYLRWLGITPAPAQAAATVLALSLPPGSPAQPLAAGLQVADPTSRLVFQVDDPILISPAWLELDPSEGTHRGAIWTGGADRSADNGGAGFLGLGAAPVAGDALMLGFDCVPVAAGETLALYAWTTTWRTDGDVRARLIAQDVPNPDCPPLSTGGADTCSECADEPPPSDWTSTWQLHYSARVVWEGWDGTSWQSFDVVTDDTRALTLSGPIRLRAGMALAIDPPGAPEAGRWWIRCRLESGGYECPPDLVCVAVNAVAAAHAALITGPEVIGISRGNAQETYRLAGVIAAMGPDAQPQPVLAGTTTLRLTSVGPPDDDWVEVPNWDRTGPADKHYRAESSTDTICFGNGWAGRVPTAGWAIEAMSYRVGGGPDGNLPAGRINRVLPGAPAGIVVHQPYDALGGTAEESLDQAHGRALDLLNTPTRGVTTADWCALALDLPGIPVARAEAIPAYHPDMGCWTASGVVTVVVVPACGHPPRPSCAFLAAVNARLQPHRPVTTELHVVGPHYVRVTVAATLHTSGAPAGLGATAQSALDAFFDPLTGGPDGTGWPFGRGVLASDVLALLARLPGVRYVDELQLTADDNTATCDNLDLCPTDLIDSQTHRLTVVEATS